MFTGIIQYVGQVLDVLPSSSGRRLAVDLGPLAEGLAPGGSVAVNGACLTAAELSGATATFDVVSETLARTTLGRLRRGDPVNLERALQACDALDGHIVQGHVDGVARVRGVRTGDEWRVDFEAPPELTAFMVPKGSIAIDGVSLTLAEVADGRFSVALIPTTLARTTLAKLAPGSLVNIETDILGKYVRKFLDQLAGNGLSIEKLRNAGFA